MLNKKKNFIDKIPNWGWLMISLATAVVLWYVLSPSGPQDPFSVGRYGGRLSLTGPLDFEQRDRYHLQLLAHDGPHEGRANLTVFVEDVNDNSPAFSQTLYQVPVPPHHHPRAQGCS